MEENELQTSAAHPNDSIIKITGMYQDWFLDYASYVILERAVLNPYSAVLCTPLKS